MIARAAMSLVVQRPLVFLSLPNSFPHFQPPTQSTCQHNSPLRCSGTTRADLNLSFFLEEVLCEALEANQRWTGPLEPRRTDAYQLERA